MHARTKLSWLFLVVPLILSVNVIGITEAQETHDIAVISVTPDPTLVELGDLVNIAVVVENQGTENETFDVTLYYDTITIETQNVSNLATGANMSLTFVWNTTKVYPLDILYKIEATASTVPGETDTADNTLVSPSRVSIFASPYIAVVPHSTVDLNLTIGTTYTVSIYTDYNGSDVWGYDFSLRYNPSILHGVEVTNGDLITEDKDPNAQFTPGDFDNNAGELTLTRAVFYYVRDAPGLWPVPVTSGPGTLANVTFKVVGTGDSDITLGLDAKLVGFTDVQLGEDDKYYGYGEAYPIIDDTTPDLPQYGHMLPGYFRNTAETVTHDVAVASVTFTPTSVMAGEPVNITVVVENQGTTNESVTVAAYYSTEAYITGAMNPNRRIATPQTVQILEPEIDTSLNFVWDTAEIKNGTYFIWAEASTVLGETDTADNRLRSEGMVGVEVSAGAFRTELVIGIVVVVIVIGVSAYAIMRVRRKKPSPSLPS